MKNKFFAFSILLAVLLSSCNLSNSTNTTSSGSSVNSGISDSTIGSVINVRQIEISTNSSLTQFVGLTSKVVVTANTTPLTTSEIEWFVNNEKSATQKGLVFEFVPNVANVYNIVAKVGNVTSNTLTLNVSLPKFNLTTVEAKSINQIEIKADPGLSFSINGLSIASNSTYNIINQSYTLNLLNNMVQGTTYSISVFKPGFETLVYPFIFETRRLSAAYVLFDSKKILPGSDGLFTIEKPFGASLSKSYQIYFNHINLEGSSIPISILTNVPATAAAIAPYQTTINIERNASIQSNTYTVETTTQAGIYSHNVTINNFNINVRVAVVNPVASLSLVSPLVYERSTSVGTPMVNPFEQDEEDEYVNDVVKQETNGQYVVFRPYNGNAFELTFIIRAANFPTPLAFPIPTELNPDPPKPYTILAGVVGPNGGIMNYSNTFNSSPPSSFPFRETTGNEYRVSLFIDNKTNLGTYTYTFTATGFGLNLTRTVVILIRDFAPTIEPIITSNGQEVKANSDGSFTIYKPLGSNIINTTFSAKISNYESPLNSVHAGGAGTTSLFSKSNILRYFLDTRISYTGPLTSIEPLVTKIGLILGANADSSETINNQTNQTDTFDYTLFNGEENSRNINLLNLRDEETYTTEANSSIFDNFKTITVNTFPGTHTYTLQVGALTKIITLRVLEPTPLLITRDDVVQYGATSLLASEDNVTFNEKENKYYVNGINGWLKVNVYPFGMLTGTYSYSFSKRTPSSFQSNTDSVFLRLRTVVEDGLYDGTLKFPSPGEPGSEMTIVEQLREEGEYIYTFRINNRSVEIKVVVLPDPQLRVLNVVNNLENLAFTNGIYYIKNSTTDRFLELQLEPVNIDLDYKYLISDDGLFPIGAELTAALNDIAVIDGKMSLGITLPKVETPTREVFTYFIALYKGSLRVGTISKVVIYSEPPTVTIFFDTLGGTKDSNPIKPITGYVGANHGTLPVGLIKAGYEFNGWYLDPDFNALSEYISITFPSTDIVLYAYWTED